MVEFFLLLTAVVFTGVGYYFGAEAKTTNIVGATIDDLIDRGYLKTVGYGKNMEIVKWEDWCNDQDARETS